MAIETKVTELHADIDYSADYTPIGDWGLYSHIKTEYR